MTVPFPPQPEDDETADDGEDLILPGGIALSELEAAEPDDDLDQTLADRIVTEAIEGRGFDTGELDDDLPEFEEPMEAPEPDDADDMGTDMALPAAADEDPAQIVPPVTVGRVDPSDPEAIDSQRQWLQSLYGAQCPLANPDAPIDLASGQVATDQIDDAAWAAWVQALETLTEPMVAQRMPLAIRNRLFYQGKQWITRRLNPAGRDTGARWVEPPQPSDVSRVVFNMVKPALDLHTQVISEQRPGFRTAPRSRDPERLKQAEVQQDALEYHWGQQKMTQQTREARYANGTDGVAFWHIYWDADAGPTEVLESTGQAVRLGDPRTMTYTLEHVRVSPNATASRPPFWVLLLDEISVAEASHRYGRGVSAAVGTTGGMGTGATTLGATAIWGTGGVQNPMQAAWGGGDTVQTVMRRILYCAPSDALPNGLMLVTVDNVVVQVNGLPIPMIPVVRVPDGTADPRYFPDARLDDALEHQVRVNAVLSKWVDNVRLNAGPKLLGRAQSLKKESTMVGNMTILDIEGDPNALKPLPGMSLAPDAFELFKLEREAFEAKMGWNDSTRGNFSAGSSGRAILAQREQVERVFLPGVIAMSEAMVEWAKITLEFLRWGYDLPRTIALTGTLRPDLARQLSREDFDGIADVQLDPETLVPMPRALRLFLLEQNLEKGVITADEYRRRSPFAFTGSFETPDDMQEARAQRVAERILRGDPEFSRDPAFDIRWTDDEALNQTVLERQILLRDDLDPEVLRVATERWTALANQAQQKMGGAPQQPGLTAEGVPDAAGLPAEQQPLLGALPGLASAGVQTLMPDSDSDVQPDLPQLSQ